MHALRRVGSGVGGGLALVGGGVAGGVSLVGSGVAGGALLVGGGVAACRGWRRRRVRRVAAGGVGGERGQLGARAVRRLKHGGVRDALPESDAARAALPPLSPPPPERAAECAACVAAGLDGAFGLGRHRHHCRHCGRSFCGDHLRWRYRLPKFEGCAAPQLVCWGCVRLLRREDFENRTAGRLARTADFLHGSLPPFVARLDDTAAARARRVGEAGINLARALPLTMGARAAVTSLDAIRKYGSLGVAGLLLRDDVTRMLLLLRRSRPPSPRRPPSSSLGRSTI